MAWLYVINGIARAASHPVVRKYIAKAGKALTDLKKVKAPTGKQAVKNKQKTGIRSTSKAVDSNRAKRVQTRKHDDLIGNDPLRAGSRGDARDLRGTINESSKAARIRLANARIKKGRKAKVKSVAKKVGAAASAASFTPDSDAATRPKVAGTKKRMKKVGKPKVIKR